MVPRPLKRPRRNTRTYNGEAARDWKVLSIHPPMRDAVARDA